MNKYAMLFVASVRHQNAQVYRFFREFPILVSLTTSYRSPPYNKAVVWRIHKSILIAYKNSIYCSNLILFRGFCCLGWNTLLTVVVYLLIDTSNYIIYYINECIHKSYLFTCLLIVQVTSVNWIIVFNVFWNL